MNNREIKRLLKLEKQQIERELHQEQKISFFVSHKRLTFILVAVICFSGVAFAYHQMNVFEWFMLESMGYDQILEQNPQYQLNASVEDQDITITIEGLVTDDLNTYLYYHVSDQDGNPLRIKHHEGLRFLNSKELYPNLKDKLIASGMPYDYIDENYDIFYHNGSSSLASSETVTNREVIRFDAFDVLEGTVKILITQIQDADGEIINGEWLFNVPFERQPIETLPLDKSAIIKLPYKDMMLSVEFLKLEMGITATRLTYQDDHDDSNVNIKYDDFAINEQPLRDIFFSGSSDDEYTTIDFFPIKVEKINDITCEIDSLFIIESVLERYHIYEFPGEIEYEGKKLIIDESFTDRYQYTITDPNYATRDFEYLEFEIYFNRDEMMMIQKSWEGCLIQPDGVEIPIQTAIDAMLYPDTAKRTKTITLETYYTDQELREDEYRNYNGQSATEFRIRKEHKNIPVHHSIKILHHWFWE
jgi:hypothetical protein